MADQNLSQLTAATTLSAGDILYAVRDPAGTPLDRKITYQSAMSVALATPGLLCGGYVYATASLGALTLSIKTTAGNDPSATEPVFVNINGTVRAIIAAASTTQAAGTNWGGAGGSMFAAKAIDWFIYVVYRVSNSTVYVSASRFPGGVTVADFSGTSTNEKYLFDYSTFSTGDRVEVCGRMEFTLSAASSYNFTTPSYSGGDNYIRYPIRRTRPLNYTPTISSGYSSNPTNTVYQYVLDDDKCVLTFREATAGTSDTIGTGTYSLPWTALTLTNQIWINPCLVTDNGTQVIGFARISSAATTVVFEKIGGWTASGNRNINGAIIEYQIA